MDGSRTLDAVSCASDGAKPSAAATLEDRRSCTYRLDVGTPSAWAPSSCTASATQDTPYSCIRSGDNAPVDVPTYCNHAAVVTQSAAVYSGCEGEWRTEVSSCQADEKSTYTPICWKWSAAHTTGEVVAETYCNPTTKPAVRVAGCEGHWTSLSGSCNSSNLIDVTATCVNNATGATAASETMCNPSTKPVANATCTGTWSNVAGTCSNGVQTPTVTCRVGGNVASETMCNPSAKPATASQSCGGTWNSVPGACNGTTQTPTVTCQVNGSVVANGYCVTADKPSTAAKSCTAKCDALVEYSFSTSPNNQPNDQYMTNVTTRAAAQTQCNAAAASKGTGTCSYNGNSYIVYYKVESAPSIRSSPAQLNAAAVCR